MAWPPHARAGSRSSLRRSLVSHGIWRGPLGADPDVIGRRLTLDGVAHEVIGVMPQGHVVRGGEPEVFVPWIPGPDAASDRRNGFLGGIARLRAGSSLAVARLELETAADRLTAADGSETPVRPVLRPISEVMTGRLDAFPPLAAAVGLLLTLVVLTGSQLQLAAARGRAREMSIRAFLGAGRWPRFRLVLMEGSILALIAVPLGTALAAGLLRSIPDLGGRLTYRALPPSLGPTVLTVTALVIGLVALGATLLPAWRAASAAADPGAMASRSRGSRCRGCGQRGSGWLVVGQIAVAFVLVTAAGLLVRATDQLLRSDLGFEPARLMQAEVTLPAARYPSAESVAAFYPRLLEAIGEGRGVTAVNASVYTPGGGWGFRPTLDGDVEVPRDERPEARWVVVTSGYFETVGLRLIGGRVIGRHDTENSPPVTVLSRTAAIRLFGGSGDRSAASASAALGRRLRFDGRWHEVVGVVSDVHRDPFSAADATVYFPHFQRGKSRKP